jgi:hypothetical protein
MTERHSSSPSSSHLAPSSKPPSAKGSVRSAKDQLAGLKDLESDFLKLTVAQRLYVEARATGMTQKASCRAAGVDDSHSANYENHPRIKRILQGTAKFALRKIAVSREDVLEGFMDAVYASQTSTELVAAWREIGRLVGAYEPEQVTHTHIHKTQEQMEQMSDEELLKLADHDGFTLDGEYTVDIPDELEATDIGETGLDLPWIGTDADSED